MTRVCFIILILNSLTSVYAQPFVHDWAHAISENHLEYCIDENGEITAFNGACYVKRVALRTKGKDSFEVKEYNKNGSILLHTFMFEPDPISKQFEKAYYRFDESGDTMEYQDYKNGRKHGDYHLYFQGGQMKEKGQYKRGQQQGEWHSYHENGVLRSSLFYKAGVKEGVFSEYYESGNKKAQGRFLRGEKFGQWLFYYENGNLSSKTTYIGGKKVGPYYEFHSNGQPSLEGGFIEGKRVGQWQYYDEFGHHVGYANYENNIAEGAIFRQYMHDTLIHGMFENGKFTGFCRWFSSNNELILEEHYQRGAVLSSHAFDVRGNILLKALWKSELPHLTCFDADGNILAGCVESTIELPHTKSEVSNGLIELLSRLPISGLNYRGVYGFDVDETGKILNWSVISKMSPSIDSTLKEALHDTKWIPGSFYGQKATYSNHLLVNINDGKVYAQFGQFYLSALPGHFSELIYPHPLLEHTSEPAFAGGGLDALNAFVASETKYPAQAKQRNVTGFTVISFSIEPSGVISEIRPAGLSHPAFEYEGKRVVEQMPFWNVQPINLKNKSFNYNLPFRFTLN